MSYTQTQITYPLYLSSSLEVAGGITGSILGTASYSATASYIPADVTASYAQTASYINNTTQSLSMLGDLTIQGTINAVTLNTVYITSSNDFVTGSSKFGDQLTDVHQFTGSVSVDGTFTASNMTGSLFGTASVALSASTALFAEDIVVYARNTTAALMPKGTVVRISGGNGDNPSIGLASNNSEALSANTLGITNEAIAVNGFGSVLTQGRLLGVDFSTYTIGQLLYLGIDGAITGSAPLAPSHSVRLGQVLRNQNNGTAYIDIDNGYELDELHDVLITSPVVTGSVIAWTGEVWANTTTINVTASYVPTLQQVVTSGNQTSSSINITGSLTQGANVLAGLFSHAEGSGSRAFFTGSHAEGIATIASASYSHAEGSGSITLAVGAHAEGLTTTAFGVYSHAEGDRTIASGSYSHAEGLLTVATSGYAHAEGWAVSASALYAHAEGQETLASGQAAHAEGLRARAIGNYSHAEGATTTAIGVQSHTEGQQTTAFGTNSHAEGQQNLAFGYGSHAEGNQTTTIGQYAHAEGFQTTAPGNWAHTEGNVTTAAGAYSHAEGSNTRALGGESHAEGYLTTAIGQYSHAEGQQTTAKFNVSHAEGWQTITGKNLQLAAGQFNSENSVACVVIGGGTATSNRLNIMEFHPSGSGLAPTAVMPTVSSSLDFLNDGAAAAAGVPLGGIYRNGNVLAIRIV